MEVATAPSAPVMAVYVKWNPDLAPASLPVSSVYTLSVDR